MHVTISYTIDTPFLIRTNETLQQQRREYTEVRDIIQKRLKRIDANAVAGKYDSNRGQDPRRYAFYKYWQSYGGRVPKLSEINEKDIPKLLAMMKQQVGSETQREDGSIYKGWETGTMKGIAEYTKNRIEGLHKAGYTEINEDNIADFGEFMEQYRARHYDHIIGSPEAVELYVKTQFKGINKKELLENFSYFVQHEAEIENMDKDTIREDIMGYKLKKGKETSWQK